MTSTIQALFQSPPAGTAGVATVSETKDGLAVTIDLSGTSWPVAGHLSQVEALAVGDRVVTLRTGAGMIVVGRLRAGNASPAPRLEAADGCLLVEAVESVRLQAGETMIEVRADGRIALDGRRISGRAAGQIRLSGAEIKLN
jgi:hypothetical protein